MPLDAVTGPTRIGVLVAASLVAAGGAAVLVWQIQDWRYGQQLEHQARLQADTLNELALAGATVQRKEQDKRLALERRLKASDDSHFSELTNVQIHQKIVRDQLATTQLRLSVLLAATDSGSCSVSAAAGTRVLVHGPRRAELEPAHAQRIIGITDDGDRGLTALKACQDYARKVSSPK